MNNFSQGIHNFFFPQEYDSSEFNEESEMSQLNHNPFENIHEPKFQLMSPFHDRINPYQKIIGSNQQPISPIPARNSQI